MQTIKAYMLVLLSILIGSGAVLILLPVTWLWLFCVLFIISRVVCEVVVGVMEAKPPLILLDWAVVAFPTVILPGYGLLSLWWMVFSYRTVTFREVPKKIWLGLAIGCAYALSFSGIHRLKLAASPPFISYEAAWEGWTLDFWRGLGPLLILFLLLLAMWLRGRDEVSKSLPPSEEPVVNL